MSGLTFVGRELPGMTGGADFGSQSGCGRSTGRLASTLVRHRAGPCCTGNRPPAGILTSRCVQRVQVNSYTRQAQSNVPRS